MRKTIGGKRYDSDTGRVIGVWNNKKSGDEHVTEKLQRTKAGHYFLHGIGGANSIYSTATQDGRIGIETIIAPMSEDAVTTWAKEKLTTAQRNAINSPAVGIHIIISQNLRDDIGAYCAKNDCNMTSLIIDAINAYIYHRSNEK